jgi:hypothetical protein
MWELRGIEVERDRLGSMEPGEILFEYDGEPLTFVALGPDGEPLLVHSLSASDGISRYLVSAVDSRMLGDLKAGRIDILTALRQPRCWVADVAQDASIRRVWPILFEEIPEGYLPRCGVMLM